MASDKKKNIVLACEIYPPDIGGPATYAHELRDQLSMNGYRVSVVTLGETVTGEISHEDTSVIERKRSIIARTIVYFFQLMRMSVRSDVVYAMGPGVSGVCAVVAGALRKKKVVVKVTGDRAWEAARLRGNVEEFEVFQTRRHRGKVWLFELLERWVVRHADAVIVPGNFLKRIVEGWGARREKIKVIHNAVDARIAPRRNTRHPDQRRAALRLDGAAPLRYSQSAELGTMPAPSAEGFSRGRPSLKENIDGRNGTILAIGRLVPWKGFDDVIATLPMVRQRVSGASLVIVGDGPERERLHMCAHEYGVSDYVQFAGMVPHDELREYWVRANVFVLASGYEGFPHLILEAWMQGVPVIASDIPSNCDILTHGSTGLITPYKDSKSLSDALIKILNDERLVHVLVENASKELEMYQWQMMVKKIVNTLFPPTS